MIQPAAGIKVAMTGSRPIGANSVTPMPKAPAASASNGGLSFIVAAFRFRVLLEGSAGAAIKRSPD